MKITEQVWQFAEPLVKENGCSLWDVEYVREGGEWFLRLYIDKEGGVDIDDCENVSRAVDPVLDEKDPIAEEYTLEVCSPGAEREIRDLNELDAMAGEYVYVRLREPFKKMLEITGEILSVENDLITLEYRDKAARRKAEFTKDNIDYIRLAVRI